MRALLTLLILTVFVACAPDREHHEQGSTDFITGKSTPSPSAPIDWKPVPVDNNWTPEKVDLNCSLGTCPEQIGVVIFSEAQDATHFQLYRCTAFLIEADKIMTNGHCDLSAKAPGFFITRSDWGTRQVKKVAKLLYKTYVVHPHNEKLLSGFPDAAVFQLESAVTGMTPLKLANGRASRAFTKLTAYVANVRPGGDEMHMSIGKLECAVHRHEIYFPYDLNENPDVITAFGCFGEHGNSGSPVFADGGREVEAILQGFNDREANGSAIRTKLHREPAPHESVDYAMMSSVRCLDYPAKTELTCVHPSNDENNRRFNAKQHQIFEQLKKRTLGGAFETQFTAMPFSLVAEAGTPTTEFEVYYNPSCRTADPKQILFPTEHVKVTLSQWAEPQITSLSTATSTGAVKAITGDTYTVDVTWAAAFGKYLEAEKDPRIQLGKAFSIALPRCAR